MGKKIVVYTKWWTEGRINPLPIRTNIKLKLTLYKHFARIFFRFWQRRRHTSFWRDIALEYLRSAVNVFEPEGNSQNEITDLNLMSFQKKSDSVPHLYI